MTVVIVACIVALTVPITAACILVLRSRGVCCAKKTAFVKVGDEKRLGSVAEEQEGTEMGAIGDGPAAAEPA